MPFRVTFNSPVIVTFALIATVVTLLFSIFGKGVLQTLSSPAHANWLSIGFYVRLLTHVFGHAGWEHLISNLALILLVGPLMEEKYGPADLLEMIAITAVVTALAALVLSDRGVVGASGIAFMLILLSAMASAKNGEIPLTFILVAVLFLGSEIISAVRGDAEGVSHLAHIVGGLCGAAFGYLRGK